MFELCIRKGSERFYDFLGCDLEFRFVDNVFIWGVFKNKYFNILDRDIVGISFWKIGCDFLLRWFVYIREIGES